MDIIASLHEDHINVAQVAGVAREELRRLAAGEAADYALLEDIMCYVTGYPDTHHHPTEDIVFARLKERSPARSAPLKRSGNEKRVCSIFTKWRANKPSIILSPVAVDHLEVEA